MSFTTSTPFTSSVWALLDRIPRGRVVTYGDLARALGKPRAARAVAQACARNPYPFTWGTTKNSRSQSATNGEPGGPSAVRLRGGRALLATQRSRELAALTKGGGPRGRADEESELLHAPRGETGSAMPSGRRAQGSEGHREVQPALAPCHRVVMGDGRVGGYSGPGGIRQKVALLEREGVHVRYGKLTELRVRRYRFTC